MSAVDSPADHQSVAAPSACPAAGPAARLAAGAPATGAVPASSAGLFLRQVVRGFAADATTTDAHTEWFCGDLAPARIGWYERQLVANRLRHWWDGSIWRLAPGGIACLQQVGSYPCWRGLKEPAQESAQDSAQVAGSSAVPLSSPSTRLSRPQRTHAAEVDPAGAGGSSAGAGASTSVVSPKRLSAVAGPQRTAASASSNGLPGAADLRDFLSVRLRQALEPSASEGAQVPSDRAVSAALQGLWRAQIRASGREQLSVALRHATPQELRALAELAAWASNHHALLAAGKGLGIRVCVTPWVAIFLRQTGLDLVLGKAVMANLVVLPD